MWNYDEGVVKPDDDERDYHGLEDGWYVGFCCHTIKTKGPFKTEAEAQAYFEEHEFDYQ